MIIAVLAVLGLCTGSFVNALVWRLREQDKKAKSTAVNRDLSILWGRSMCPHCKHKLANRDLVPVLSWVNLGGKCRYCGKPISIQYPAVEFITALLFIASYIWWPAPFNGAQLAIFGLWLVLLTGLIALLVYDLRWMLLPDRLVYPLGAIAAVLALLNLLVADRPLMALLNLLFAVAVGGGLFYVIFQISDGKWIGGGDVKLGWLLGLIVGTPSLSFLIIFIAAVGGCLVSLPLLASGRLKRQSTIPFGPFLIIAAIIVQLFGNDILHWYGHTILMVS